MLYRKKKSRLAADAAKDEREGDWRARRWLEDAVR